MIYKLTFKSLLLSAVLLLPWAAVADDRSADREAINELMWRYTRALDTLNPAAYAAVYTEDGEFGSGQNASTGHDELKAMINGVIERREQREAEGGAPSGPMYHMTTNSRIEFVDDTHARHHSYWMTVFGPAEQGESPRIAAVGRGIDYLVKENGQWLIQKRDVAPDSE